MNNLYNLYKDNKLSHAYIIETNDVDACEKELLNVIKKIFCVDEFSNDCKKCSLCHLVDIDSLPSLKIISPDKLIIKKEQILELERLFSLHSNYTKDKIYIIKNAEKLNKESSNSMLKFIEEPSDNTYGFFITSNIDGILLTIQSRCQKILYKSNNYKQDEFIIEKAEQLYIIFNNNCSESILFNRKFFENIDKEQIIEILKILLNKYKNELDVNSKSYKLDCKKYNLIVKLLEEINYNLNIDLMLDSLLIQMEDINNESI